jgi:hypothetical protein
MNHCLVTALARDSVLQTAQGTSTTSVPCIASSNLPHGKATPLPFHDPTDMPDVRVAALTYGD